MMTQGDVEAPLGTVIAARGGTVASVTQEQTAGKTRVTVKSGREAAIDRILTHKRRKKERKRKIDHGRLFIVGVVLFGVVLGVPETLLVHLCQFPASDFLF